MKRGYFALFLVVACSSVLASPKVWESGWGQGKTEFYVGDEQTNYLNFACDPNDEESPVSGSATINGKSFYSHNDSGGFDVVVDGKEFGNPFFVECRACASWFKPFWNAMRKASKIEVRAGGQSSSIPVKGLSGLLKPYDSDANPCSTGTW